MPIEQKAYDSAIMGGLPYYDDFNQSKKFLKMLFKPGLPVQARELSQAQTILQNQIERLGSNIFRNGSVVLGGGVSTAAANFVRLQNDLPLATLKRLVNQKIRAEKSDGSLVDAIVCGYADKSTLENDSHQIVFVKYITVGEFSEGDTIFTIGVGNIGVTNTVLPGAVAPGAGDVQTFVTVEEGIFFIDGYFCIAEAQSAAATKNDDALGYRTFSSTNSAVGFNAVKSVVTPESDSTLRDPSFGFNNFNAPGADRFKIDPVLESRSLSGTAADSNSYTIDDPTNFFELVRVIGGRVTKKIKYPELAELEKTLARRTFDESGNYTVQPFEIEVGTHEEIFGSIDNSKFGVKLSPGKAYVSGFEFETIAPTFLTIDKGTDVLTSTRSYGLDQGSFFSLKATKQSTDFDPTSPGSIIGATLDGYINNSTSLFLDGSPVDLEDADGEKLGTVVPTHFMFGNESSNAPVRLYFHSKEMFVGAKDSNIKRIVKRDTNNNEILGITCDFSGSGLDSIILSNSSRVADISSGGSVSDLRNPLRMTFIKPFKGTTDSNGVVGFTSGVGSKDFLATIGEDIEKAQIRPVGIVNMTNSSPGSGNEDDLVLIQPTLVPSIDNNVGSISLNFGADYSSKEITCFLPVSYESVNNIRKKTISGNQTVTINSLSELLTTTTLSLNTPDVKQIISISEEDTGNDVTARFELNTGQSDFAYEFSSISLADPSDTVINRESPLVVTFTKYLHTGDGPFTKDSYVGIDETELAAVNSAGNSPVDVLDFRPIIDANGNYTQGTGEPGIVPFSSTAVPSFVTVSTFLPRIDSVVLTNDRKLVVVQGIPDNDPVPPRISSGDLELYRVRVNGASSEAQTLQVEYIDNQRFTMSDINDLEERTTDDFVDNYRKNLRVSMVARGNAAFVDAVVNEDDVYVDDLFGYENIDSVNSSVNVAFDPIKNKLRPAFKTTVLTDFTVDELKISGVTVSNDGVALTNFTEPAAPYITQQFSNNPVSSVDINPFGINDYLGSIKLTPHRAKYWSESRRARVITNVRGELNAYESELDSYSDNAGRRKGFGTVWRDWEVFWCGVEERDRDIEQNKVSSRVYNSPKKSATIRRILSEKTKKTVSGRVIDLSIKPYLDTFTLNGVVEGVLPGATYNLFFDGVMQNLSTQPYQASTGPTAGGGTFEFTTVIPADTYTTGKKLVRVISGSADDNVLNCDSSADAIFYGEGRPDTELFGNTLIRPPTVRRKAADVNETSDEYFSDVFEQSNATLVNALNPVSQTFNVDAELYPNGLFINEVNLWFTQENKDVTLRIHPTRAGNPVTSIVMPFAEKTSITKSAVLNETGLLTEVSDDTATAFKFSTPVFLPAGEYSISVTTNDTETRIVTYDETSGDAPLRPSSMLKIYLPQNDGSVVGYNDQYFAMKITKCAFDTGVGQNFTLSTSAANNTPTDALFVSSNPQISSAQTVSCGVQLNDQGTFTVQPNNTVTSRNLGGRILTGTTPTLTFNLQSDGDVTSVVDTEAVALFLPAADITARTTLPTGELSNENDVGSENHFRYYSKVVESDSFMSGIVVAIDGSFEGLDDLRVFCRTTVGDEDIFSQDFFEVFLGGPNENDDTAPASQFSPSLSSATYFRRRDTNIFTKYQFKIVGVRDESATSTEAFLPEINFVGAAPVRSASAFIANQGTVEFGDTALVPRGSVFAVLGKPDEYTQEINGVSRYLELDGGTHSTGKYPDLRALLVASGVIPDDNPDEFTLPNLSGRTLVGAGTGIQNDSTGGLTTRFIGDLIGSEIAPGGQQIEVTVKSTSSETGGGEVTALRTIDVVESNVDTSSNLGLVTATAEATDGSGSTTNLQPSFVVNYIIKT